MKKLLLLLTSVFILISCGSDDSPTPVVEPSIVGSWEVTKRGQLINNNEVFQTYPSDCPTKKDLWYFYENKSFNSIYFDSNCVIFTHDYYHSWNINQNSLILFSHNSMDFYEILVLNDTTLKIRYQDINGEIIIIEFKRFNQN